MGKAAQGFVMTSQTVFVLWKPRLPSSLPGYHMPICAWVPFWIDAALLHHDVLLQTKHHLVHMQAQIREEDLWKCVDVLKSAELIEFIPK